MANPAFPRTILPIEVSSLESPGPLISKAQSGRVNIRSLQQSGHTWTERYLVNVRSVNGRALLAAVNNFWRNGTVFTIDHRDHVTPLGAGGGSPLINQPTQLVTDPENFGAWTISGTPILTGGQSAPFGGTAAYAIADDSATVDESIVQAIPFTGNATKAVSVFVKRSNFNIPEIGVLDGTTWRHRVRVTFDANGTVTSVTTLAGTGIIFPAEQWGNGWWRISISADGVLAASTNYFVLYPAGTVVSDTGTTFFFGANAWNAVVPAGYIGPSHLTATGSLIYLDGAAASVTNWLRAGDILSIGALAPVYEVTADVSSQAGGYAVVPINPPIFTGAAPGDNAAITITGVTLQAVILEPPSFPTTSGVGADYGELVCKFSESL